MTGPALRASPAQSGTLGLKCKTPLLVDRLTHGGRQVTAGERQSRLVTETGDWGSNERCRPALGAPRWGNRRPRAGGPRP